MSRRRGGAARRRSPGPGAASPGGGGILETLPAAIPYACVIPGIHVFHSAWGAVLAYHAVILVLLVRDRRTWWRALRGGWSSGPGLLLSAACVAAGPAFVALWPWMRLQTPPFSESLDALGLSGGSFVAFAVYYAVVHPVLEEILWRGVLASPRRGPSVRDGLFAGYHLLVLPLFVTWAWVAVSGAVLLGAAWLWRRLAAAHGGLAIPVVTHALADAGIVFAALYLAGR